MSYRPQRDPFDDGMQSLVSAMNVSHRVPGAKEPDMQNLGKKIINNAKTRPQFARKVTELYTNEDSWLSNFLRKEIKAAKPAIKPEYFGGSPDEKTVAVGDSINATAEGEGDSASEGDSVSEGESEAEEGGGEESETIIKEVEGTISQEEFGSKTNLTAENKVRAIRSFIVLPEGVEVQLVKNKRASLVKIFVENEEAIEMVRSQVQDFEKRLKETQYDDPKYNNLKKLVNFIVTKTNNVIVVKPGKQRVISPPPKKVSKKKSKTKSETMSETMSETKSTPANTAIASTLSNSGGAESPV